VAAIPGTTVTNRAHFRNREHSVRQVREAVRTLIDHPLWRSFEQANAEQFPRHMRDQAGEATRHFCETVDMEILCSALQFCLENHTLSYASLNDTYKAFISDAHAPLPIPSLPELSIQLPSVEVTQRSLSTYQKILTSGANQ